MDASARHRSPRLHDNDSSTAPSTTPQTDDPYRRALRSFSIRCSIPSGWKRSVSTSGILKFATIDPRFRTIFLLRTDVSRGFTILYPSPTFQRRVFSPLKRRYVGNSGDSQGLKGLRVIPRFPPIDRFELWNYFSRFLRADRPTLQALFQQICFCFGWTRNFIFFVDEAITILSRMKIHFWLVYD